MSVHLIDGEFQSDKYPTTPRGKVPLSVRDKDAQDLLWQYAERHRSRDAEFSSDLETALVAAGYVPPSAAGQIDAWSDARIIEAVNAMPAESAHITPGFTRAIMADLTSALIGLRRRNALIREYDDALRVVRSIGARLGALATDVLREPS